MPNTIDWQKWAELNRQLLEQWRALLASMPQQLSPDSVSSTPAPLTSPPPPTFPHFAPGSFFSSAMSPTATPEPPQQEIPQPPQPPADSASSDDVPENYEIMELMGLLAEDVMALFQTGEGCIYVSPNYQRITGHSCVSALQDGFYHQLSPIHQKAFLTALTKAVSEEPGQLSLYPLQFELLHADGGARTYSVRIGDVQPLASGEHMVVCMLHDIQDQLDAEKATKEARRDTQRALQSRTEFLNAMSHELRTPLNAILGFTQIMENEMYGPISNLQYHEYLKHISESGYDLLTQIDEVMEMAANDAEEKSLDRENCELDEMLHQIIAMHRTQAKSARVALHSHVSKNFARVRVDRVKLQHCLSHLLSNAIRFSRSGGEVLLDADLDEENGLRITISDSGIGMSARKLQQVLNLLQQSETAPVSPPQPTLGRGMGLALAREYASRHRGYITVDSKVGEGTTVCLHLPTDCIIPGSQKILHHPAFTG